MSATTAEIIGFCNQFTQLLEDNKTDLKDKGLDVTNWITEINSLKDDAVTKDAQQDQMRAAAKAKAKEAQDARKFAYKTTSSRLDAVIGVLGKDTPAAKEAARLRSSINRQKRKKNGDDENS
jgi:hypothetical protein